MFYFFVYSKNITCVCNMNIKINKMNELPYCQQWLIIVLQKLFYFKLKVPAFLAEQKHTKITIKS